MTVAVKSKDVHVVVNAGPANLVVDGEGDPLGPLLGAVAVAADDGVAVAAAWTPAEDLGYSATAGPASQLHAPPEPETTQTGFWVVTRKGSGNDKRGAFIPYGVSGAYPVEVSDAGEVVIVTYTTDDTGLPPHFVVTQKAGNAVDEDTVVSIRQANAAPDTSITEAELSALQGSVATLQGEYRQLAAQGQSHGGQATPVVTTQIDGFSLSGRTLTLQWTRNGSASELQVRLPQTHTFELVADATDLAAADADDTLLATAAIGGTTFVAGDVLAHDGATWVRVINLGSTAHTIPAGSVDIDKLSPDLQTKLRGLLTLANVDHQITVAVEGFGRKDTTDRIPETRLPLALDNFIDALSGGTWADSTTTKVVLVTVANPANIEQQPFATSISGPRRTDIFVGIETPESAPLSLRRIAIGSLEGGDWRVLRTGAWTEVEHDGGFRYFTTPLDNLPAAAILRAQDLAPFELDHEVLGINEFTDEEKDKLRRLDISRLVAQTAPGQGGYVYKQNAAGIPGWHEDAGDVRQGAWETDTEGNAVISPAPGDVPANTLLEVGNRLFQNGGTRWIEIAEAGNVVKRGDEVYPAHVVAPNSELSRSRFQVENVNAPDRNDQALAFNGWADHFIASGTPPTQRNYGAAHATTLPGGFLHMTYYPPGYPVPALAGKFVITASPQLVAFDPRILRIRKSGEQQGADRALNVTAYTQRRNGRDVFLGYQATPAAADRPSKAGATNYLVNLSNASANFIYVSDGSSAIQYVDWSQLAPRQIGAASNDFLGRLRSAGDNTWAAAATNAGALGRLLRGNFPDGWRCQFVVQEAANTAKLYSEWIECDELTALAALANTGTGRVIRRQILGQNDVPTEQTTSGANCFQLSLRGRSFLWVGFLGDRLTAQSDHAANWTDASTVAVRVKPF